MLFFFLQLFLGVFCNKITNRYKSATYKVLTKVKVFGVLGNSLILTLFGVF